MIKVMFFLLLTPLALFGKVSAQPAAPSQDKLIVANYDAEEDGPWAGTGRILTDSDEEELAPSSHPSHPNPKVSIDLKQVFKGSPTIYSLLLFLSMASVFLWLYTTMRWRVLGRYNDELKRRLVALLKSRKVNEVRILCQNRGDLLSRMVLAALAKEGADQGEIEETVAQVVKQASSASWQRIGILNDIAIIAPMLGLMGTVLGMFYAFYDINRSLDSITKLFDGLGISVATTVAGLSVALLALMLHTYLKHLLIRRISVLEREAETLVPLLVEKEHR